jgi:uncharacterized cofD-like protein
MPNNQNGPTKKIVVIGGGTGIFPVVAALRHTPNIDISTIVSVSDSGGSTGRIRDEFGFQPVGDLRQSLAALAEEDGEDWIRKLLLYRFAKGDGLKGHNLGNLILTALQDLTGSTSEALYRAEQIFRLKGQVIPATTENVNLKIVYQDGTSVVGEHILDEKAAQVRKIDYVELTPPAQINPYAAEAIIQADLIIIGPGDLYASLIAALAADNTSDAFNSSNAKVMYISNLMTRETQTHDMTSSDHVAVIEKSIGRPVDLILLNNQPIPEPILTHYAHENEHPIVDDLLEDTRVIRAPIISTDQFNKAANDTAHRSVLRHDSLKLQPVLSQVLNQL